MSTRLFFARVLACLMTSVAAIITVLSIVWCVVHLVVVLAGVVFSIPELVSKKIGNTMVDIAQWLLPKADVLWKGE